MPSMQKQPDLDDETSAVSLYRMRSRDLDHRRDAFSRYSQIPNRVVRARKIHLARFAARKIFANAQIGPREVKAFV